MDYYRRSVAKIVDSLINITDVRAYLRKYKTVVLLDSGLRTLLLDRINFIKQYSNCLITSESLDDVLLEIEVGLEEIKYLTKRDIELIKKEWGL